LGGELTIRTEFEKSSAGLQEFATQHQRWSDGDGDFDFAKVFSSSSAAQSDKGTVVKGVNIINLKFAVKMLLTRGICLALFCLHLQLVEARVEHCNSFKIH
jgi:hypothetical protein